MKSAGTVTIHDMLGNRLAVLHADNAHANLAWNAQSTGAYFARFEGRGTVETQRILVR